MTNPVQRQIQAGELVDSVANADKASKFTEQVQAATATASDQATVAGQLAKLLQTLMLLIHLHGRQEQ